jgi:CubicO group peptidase (beta-lactamase class C family)
MMGLVVSHLVDKKLLKFDTPVSKYWPEFSQGGKEEVTVSDLLSHRGGLLKLSKDRIPTLKEFKDLDLVASKIAAEKHAFDGLDVVGYEGAVGGWFVNELVRRVDPKKRSMGVIIQ